VPACRPGSLGDAGGLGEQVTGGSSRGGSEPPTPPRGKGAKGNKYNRSNAKGIAKEVIAMLRRGDDTTDDSDEIKIKFFY
jgi:hypothetical protein